MHDQLLSRLSGSALAAFAAICELELNMELGP